MTSFTLDQLRLGLQAIRDRLSSEIWRGTDAVLYGSVSEVHHHRRREDDLERIIAAFPKELWAVLDGEENRKKAADLREQAARLEAQAEALAATPDPSAPEARGGLGR